MTLYQYRGLGNDDLIDRRRWNNLDRNALAKEQIDICADTTRKRYNDALQAKGMSFTNRRQTLPPRLLRELIDTLADAHNTLPDQQETELAA